MAADEYAVWSWFLDRHPSYGFRGLQELLAALLAQGQATKEKPLSAYDVWPHVDPDRRDERIRTRIRRLIDAGLAGASPREQQQYIDALRSRGVEW